MENQASRDYPWVLWLYDGPFDALVQAGFGGVKARISPRPEHRSDYPALFSDEQQFGQEIADAIAFVPSRADLCRLLSSPATACKARLEAWQSPGNYPARLAQAILIARDLDSSELLEHAWRQMTLAPPTNEYGKQVPAESAVNGWLAKFSKVLGVDAPL